MSKKTRKPYTLNRRLANYNRTLADLFLAGACSQSALFTSARKQSATYASIQSAIKRGHIRCGQFKEIYGVRYRLQKFLTISEKGLAYLSQQKGESWFKFIPTDTGVVIPLFDRHNDRVAVASRQGNIILMAMHMGAAVTEWVYNEDVITPLKGQPDETDGAGDYELDEEEDFDFSDEQSDEVEFIPPKELEEAIFVDTALEAVDWLTDYEDTKSTPLPTIRKNTYHRAIAMGEVVVDTEDKELYYFPRAEMKARVEKAGRVVDTRFCQSVGALVSSTKSLLIYHARCDGMTWTALGQKNDQRLARQFSVYCSPYDNYTHQNNHAALVVYNAKNFRDVLFDTKNKRSAKTEIEKAFQSFHIVPLSPDGTNLLHQIAISDINTFSRSVLLDRFHATKTEGVFGKPCPFSVEGRPIFNGIPMEMNSILLMNTYLQNNSAHFAILAYPWQVDFYTHIWGEDLMFLLIDPE